MSKEQRQTFPPLCPEFLIELRLHSDSRPVLEDKMDLWMAKGAQLAWMIDLYAATVSIYRVGAAVKVTARPEWIEASFVVPGFRLESFRLWAE